MVLSPALRYVRQLRCLQNSEVKAQPVRHTVPTGRNFFVKGSAGLHAVAEAGAMQQGQQRQQGQKQAATQLARDKINTCTRKGEQFAFAR